MMMGMTSCLLLRSPKRIAEEAELVSGFTEVDFSCFCGVLPGFFVDVADFLEERKEMSDFSVEEVVGCFVEEENEWANASGWTFGGRESFSAFGHWSKRGKQDEAIYWSGSSSTFSNNHKSSIALH